MVEGTWFFMRLKLWFCMMEGTWLYVNEVRTAVLHDGRDMILHEVGAWFCMMEGVSVLHDSA